MRVQAAMTREVHAVSPRVSLMAARGMMQRRHVRHLPVVTEGRLIGILSDRDLLRHAGDEDQSTSCTVAMTAAPITCRPTTPVGRVAELMLTHKIDSVPVVNDDEILVGLVTSSDLLTLLIDHAEAQMLPFDFRLRMTDFDDAAYDVA
jgi:CBS domain-containing protein